MSEPINILWLRQDLRIQDNPALNAALADGKTMPIYILDSVNSDEYDMGGASRCWLHHSLQSLNESLNGKLKIFKGDPKTIIEVITAHHSIKGIYYNRCYEPWRIKRDTEIKQYFTDSGVGVNSFNGSLLWEPWEVLKSDQTPYRVFTPFYRKGCLNATPPRQTLADPELSNLTTLAVDDIALDELKLLPTRGWGRNMMVSWQPGEAGAHDRLHRFVNDGLKQYKKGRDFPALESVSRLSPYLHFGELSPNQAWHAARSMGDSDNIEHFCSELAWREFSYSLLYFNPELPKENLQTKFDSFPWLENEEHLKAWQRGQTGIPIVDAGMRELWQTGYMHNRVRMIVGSFLIKNLLLHWHHGERWFWDCLVDADLANNSAGWQWVAGCGADAAPYFRIFNPVTQGQKFDPHGEYTKRYVPELIDMPDKYLFNPWEAPRDVLVAANVRLGTNYPKPIIDLKASRERALEAFQTLKVPE